MNVSWAKVVLGFVVLFGLYHAAEYAVFRQSVVGFLILQAVFFVFAWAIARWQGGPGIAAWGLDFRSGVLRHLLPGMLFGAALYGTTLAVSLWAGSETIKEVPPVSAMLGPLGLFVFGVFFSSFSEDVLTRGYVFGHLRGKIGGWAIVLVSSVIYLLNHIYRLGDSFNVLLYLFLLGVLFAVPLMLTGRLWFTGGMHWAGNSVFYLTHEIIKTDNGDLGISPNYILAAVTLVFVPIVFISLRNSRLAVETADQAPA